MSAARTERLLNLLTLLVNSRRPVALCDIRELDEFGAYRTGRPKSGERAFERDKAALLELGVPLRWVPGERDDDEAAGGYLVDRQHYFLPELQLSPGDVALLSVAGAAAAALSDFSGKAAVVRALAKLGFDCQAQEAAHRVPALAHAPPAVGVDAARLGAIMRTLHDGLAARQGLSFTYLALPPPQTQPPSAASRPTRRMLWIYGLYYRRNAWYVVGHCHLRQALRTFSVQRIQAVKLTGAPQAYVIPADFDLQAQARRRPWEYAGGPPEEVTIRLAPRLRPALGEIFGDRARLTPEAEGTTLVHLRVTHSEALLHCILPYGTAAEVVAPPLLRQRIGALYARLAARYRPIAARRVS